MAKLETGMTYHCYNDCKMEGCPGHQAKLKIQTVSDSIEFYNGINKEPQYFDPSTLLVLMEMLDDLGYLPRRLN